MGVLKKNSMLERRAWFELLAPVFWQAKTERTFLIFSLVPGLLCCESLMLSATVTVTVGLCGEAAEEAKPSGSLEKANF